MTLAYVHTECLAIYVLHPMLGMVATAGTLAVLAPCAQWATKGLLQSTERAIAITDTVSAQLRWTSEELTKFMS